MLLQADEILWDVEEQHLDEAEFLFELRETACEAPTHSLDDVATGPDQRLLAHLEGLRLAGPLVAERLLLPTVEDPEQWYVRIAAATLALCSPENSYERLLEILDTTEAEEQRLAIVRALQLYDDPRLDGLLVQGLSSIRGPGVAARLEVLAGRQVATGSWLANFLNSDDLDVIRAAARLARFCSDPQVLDYLGPLARSSDPQLLRITLETALFRRLGGAWESAVYWAFAPGDSPFRRDALIWIAMLGDTAAHERLLALVDDPEHRADALFAAGFCGRLAAVERCIALLDDDEVGQLAAEVVCEIAGLPTDEDRYWQAAEADSAEAALPSLERDNLDADLVPSSEDALPLPEPEAIVSWWATHQHEFHPAMRYLGGRPLDKQVMLDALAHRPMRRRHNLALELALRTAGTARANTWAWAELQRTQLTGLASLPAIDFQRGLALARQ